jgi:hypothetical protein
MTAEDRDRLREWARKILGIAPTLRHVYEGEIEALLSAFADEERGEAEEELSIWKARAEDAEKESRLHEWEQLALKKANEADAAEAGKREAEERVKKLESALAKTTAEIIVDGNRADLKLARDVAEAEVARLREERDRLKDEWLCCKRCCERENCPYDHS